jgi:hypothetical protein
LRLGREDRRRFKILLKSLDFFKQHINCITEVIFHWFTGGNGESSSPYFLARVPPEPRDSDEIESRCRFSNVRPR